MKTEAGEGRMGTSSFTTPDKTTLEGYILASVAEADTVFRLKSSSTQVPNFSSLQWKQNELLFVLTFTV